VGSGDTGGTETHTRPRESHGISDSALLHFVDRQARASGYGHWPTSQTMISTPSAVSTSCSFRTHKNGPDVLVRVSTATREVERAVASGGDGDGFLQLRRSAEEEILGERP